MSMDQRGELFTAILRYAAGESVPELDAAADMAFSFIRERMDRDSAAYMEKVEKRREAGKLGGRPKANAYDENQTKAKKQMVFLKSKITLILFLLLILYLLLKKRVKRKACAFPRPLVRM